ncbi:NAD(P)/FAD-dependent oxidoreductase [Marinoscillum sp.]|uniref:NAD(P)/FAD-dependent oxidoreductase n=1 Tax=Marinoscillum sp. TaxID=2024838 RepID=UPI003BACF233
MQSFWERESFAQYDLIVIGAGITGLSTAASFKEKHPAADVLVIEQGTLPLGASTRNAGFACFGSISELAQDRKTLGDEGMVSLVQRRWSGLQKTISRLGEESIGLLKQGGYELLTPKTSYYLDAIDQVNQLLNPLFQGSVFQHATEKLDEFGFRNTSDLVYNPHEAQLHTGKLMKNLSRYCGQLGIQIITGTKVEQIEEETGHAVIRAGQLEFLGRSVAICTNAFTPQLITEQLNIQPGRGMVLLVKPDKPLSFRGTFHYDEGFYYFRDFDDKIIFGGGRNLAMEQESTTEFGINEIIEQKLIQDLKEVIIPETHFKVEMKWSGIMAFGDTKAPIVKRLAPRQYLGVRLGGMGVALGSLVGEELATQISQDHF